MKKVKWFLSVFLTITMLMSSFVAAVGETLEGEQPAAQTTETDGGGGGHNHTTSGGGRHGNAGTGESSEGGRHGNAGTSEGGEGGGHGHTGTDEGGGHGNPGTGEGGGHGNAGTGEGGGHGNAGTGEGDEHDNTGTGEGGDVSSGTGEGENDPIDSTGENGDEDEEIMLLGAALLMAGDASLDEGIEPKAIDLSTTYEYPVTIKVGGNNVDVTLGFTFKDTGTPGTYNLEVKLSGASLVGNDTNGNKISITIYDSNGQPTVLSLETWNGNTGSTITIPVTVPEGGWFGFDFNNSGTVTQVGHTHAWDEDYKSGGNCMTPCTIHYKCACGATSTGEGPTTDVHSMVITKVVPATCTEDGYTESTCANGCGKTEESDKTDAPGHKMANTITAPTCVDPGYTTSTCDNGCGKNETIDPTPALKHSWISLNASNHECKRTGCGEIEPHGTLTRIGSASGVETWKCPDCDYTTTKTIASPNPVTPDNPVNPGNGLVDIGDELIPLGLDTVALRMLDENLRIINSLTLGDVLNDDLNMVSALAKDGYILEFNFGALQYLSNAYPSGKYIILTDNLNVEIPFALCSALDGLAEYLQANVISADTAWLRVTFTQTSSGWNATMLAFDDGGQHLGYDIGNAGTTFFQIK